MILNKKCGELSIHLDYNKIVFNLLIIYQYYEI